jgi:MFS family permease
MEARSDTAIRRALAANPAGAAFAGVFVSCVLTFLALGAVLPVLAPYVRGPIGSTDLAVGIVTGAFAFTAVVARPLGGRWADSRGRRPVVLAGALLASLGGFLMLAPLGVAGLVVARLVVGAGEGLVFTAGAAWTVDLAPEETRGRAIGLFGLTIWTALTVGPLIGQLLLEGLGYSAVWAFAGAVSLAGAVVARALPDSPRSPAPPAGGGALVAREAFAPGASLALAAFGQAAFGGFVVLHLAERGAGPGATVFVAFGAAVVLTRLLAGRLPDVVGPRRTAVAAAACEAAGLAILAASHSLGAAIAGGIVMGFGFSVLFPSLALIAVNAAGDARRGAAMGTFTAFFDIGVGVGGLVAGAIAGAAGYPAVFWVAAAAAVAGGLLAAANAERFRGLRAGEVGLPP